MQSTEVAPHIQSGFPLIANGQVNIMLLLCNLGSFSLKRLLVSEHENLLLKNRQKTLGKLYLSTLIRYNTVFCFLIVSCKMIVFWNQVYSAANNHRANVVFHCQIPLMEV